MAQCIGCAVFDRDIDAVGCRRQDCNGAKQRYGNRGGTDMEYDFRFHLASSSLLVLPVPSEMFARRGKKFENPLGPRTHNTDRAEGGTRQTLERKIGENKAASRHWLRCLTLVMQVIVFLNQFLLQKDLRGRFQLPRLHNIAQFPCSLVRQQQQAFLNLNHKR
jgi:hypothetical protein